MNQPVKVPFTPGFLQRAAQGLNYMIRGVGGPNDWFGPHTPISPQAPEGVRGRAWDFPVGSNLQYVPRSNEGVSFEQLRALADNYDLLRLCIETRKDQMAKLQFGVQPKKGINDTVRPKPDDRCKKIEEFLTYPDRRHTWTTWLRLLLEDMFVIDAATIYPRKTNGGDLYSLDIVDGATIKPLIGLDGRQPLSPDPAYQQILHGVVAASFEADELHYLPRNPRTNKFYGYSSVEQIIMTINIGLRRQISTLQYYTEGNIPEALCGVPIDWQPDQIKQFQEYWDSLLEGNSAARRHMKFVPGDLKVQFTKDAMLKDEYDEWLARVICYNFSLPPLPFVKQQNRATADSAKEQAEEEGLIPVMNWIKEFMNLVICKDFGAPDLEFIWQDEEELKRAEQSAVDINEINNGLISLDEVRAKRGLDPYGIGPFIKGVGPTGLVFIEDLKDPNWRTKFLYPEPQQQIAIGPDGQPVAPALPGPQDQAALPAPATGAQALPTTDGSDPTIVGYTPEHQQALAAMTETLREMGGDGGVQAPPQPHQGFNETHQRALDELHSTVGGEPAPSPVEVLSPGFGQAVDALMRTLRQ